MDMGTNMGTDIVITMKKKTNFLDIFIKKTTFWDAELLRGRADIHSHCLPKVDDGMQSVEEAVEALIAMARHGVERVFFTPHVMEDYPENSTAFLKERFAEFQKIVSKNCTIEVILAAEYMLDAAFYKHLGELLCFKDNHLLIEMSYLSPSPNLDNTIYNLQVKGYNPILAHPERYLFMDREDYQHLKHIGCKYQLNLMSLSGQYGKRAYDVGWYLLQNGLYDFAGTDMHNYKVFHRSMSRLKLTKQEITLIQNLIDKNREL